MTIRKRRPTLKPGDPQPAVRPATEPLRLVVIGPDGNPVEDVLPGPGRIVRVSIGQEGKRASVWNIWANRTQPDVYVAARTVAGVQKFSLHASGDWRQQWVSTEHAMEHTGSPNRVIDQWTRPTEAPAGWGKGLTIMVPYGHLQDMSDDHQRKPVIWLPEPGEGRIAGIHIAVVKPDQGVLDNPGARPVTGFSLSNGDGVVVLYSQAPLVDAVVDTIRDGVTKAAHAMTDDLLRILADPPPGLRMALHAGDDSGHRVVYDLSAPTVDLGGA